MKVGHNSTSVSNKTARSWTLIRLAVNMQTRATDSHHIARGNSLSNSKVALEASGMDSAKDLGMGSENLLDSD